MCLKRRPVCLAMANSVVDTLNCTSRLCRYIGLFPFYISTDGHLIVCKLWTIWAIIVHTVLICMSMIALMVARLQYTSDILFVLILSYFELFAFQIVLTVHLIWIILCRKKLDVSIRQLVNQEQLEIVKSSFWFPLSCYVGVFILMLVECLLLTTDDPRYIFFSVLDYTQSAFAFAIIFQFTDLLDIYRQAIRKLASSCRKCQQIEKSYLLRQYELNDAILKCCETLNYCFGPALLIMVLCSFVIISSNLFMSYDYWHDKVIVIVSWVWIVLFLCPFRRLVKSCEDTTATANQFYHSLLETLMKEKQLANDQTFNLMLIMRKKLKFTAFGYFYIDYGIFCSMLAASVTYFVIFTEFNSLTKEGKTSPTEIARL